MSKRPPKKLLERLAEGPAEELLEKLPENEERT